MNKIDLIRQQNLESLKQQVQLATIRYSIENPEKSDAFTEGLNTGLRLAINATEELIQQVMDAKEKGELEIPKATSMN